MINFELMYGIEIANGSASQQQVIYINGIDFLNPDGKMNIRFYTMRRLQERREP